LIERVVFFQEPGEVTTGSIGAQTGDAE
jgi:hypothetical protein